MNQFHFLTGENNKHSNNKNIYHGTQTINLSNIYSTTKLPLGAPSQGAPTEILCRSKKEGSHRPSKSCYKISLIIPYQSRWQMDPIILSL